MINHFVKLNNTAVEWLMNLSHVRFIVHAALVWLR